MKNKINKITYLKILISLLFLVKLKKEINKNFIYLKNKKGKIMKKTALSLMAMLGVLVSSTAFAKEGNNNGFYVQGDVGYAKFQLKEAGEKVKDNQFNQKLTFGYDFGDVRTELNYTNNEKFKNKFGDGVDSIGEATIKNHALSATVIYDIDNRSNLTPYIGAKLSQNFIKNKVNYVETGMSYSHNISKTKLGYGAIVGIDYEIADGVSLNLAGEYDYVGKIDNVKMSQFGVKTGIKYVF